MKRFLLLALLFCTGAFADTTSTSLPTSAVWTLIRGNTGAVGWNFLDAAACWKSAAADVESRKSSSTYVCRQDLKFTTTYVKPVNPFPNGETQTVQCVAPAVGNWTQTRTYTLVIGKYVAGAWSPTVAPAGACVAPLAFTRIANEGEAFNVTANSTVRFGADTRWVQKVISGAGSCTNVFFGSDPAVGTAKQCEVANGSMVVVPTKPADIVTTVQCVAPLVGSWTQTTTTALVNNVWVASAPTPAAAPAGACAAPVVTPPATTDTVWMNFATEGDNAVAYTGLVRYGNGIGWASKTVSGSFDCSSGFFGGDPSPGFEKYCQKQVSATHVSQVAGAMPVINPAFVQGPAKGKPGPRLGGTAGSGDLGNPNQDTGAMREPCRFSHFLNDDPIVFPGQSGKSHLHLFFGNVDANASTTAANIMAATTSTCFGGTLNNTAYWTPAVVDIRTGKPLVPEPDSALFYYKGGYLGVKMADIQPFPAGLRMIAGTSSFTTEVAQAGVVRIWCDGGDGTIRNRIPSCNRGERLSFEVIFPQCWDGVNLDSPNHKDHMAYANNGCPATHPVPLPEISMNLHYVVEESGTDQYLRLSSDNYSGVGGFSMHADWFNGWEPATLKLWVTNCINPSKDCHSALMGNGQWLY